MPIERHAPDAILETSQEVVADFLFSAQETLERVIQTSLSSEETVDLSRSVDVASVQFEAPFVLVTTETRTIQTTVAAITETQQAIPSTLAVLRTHERNILSSFVLQAEDENNIPTAFVVQAEEQRILSTAITSQAEQARTIQTSISGQTEQQRSIPTAMSLLADSSRTFATTAALVAEQSRAWPTTVAAQMTQARTMPTALEALSVAETIKVIPTSLTTQPPARDHYVVSVQINQAMSISAEATPSVTIQASFVRRRSNE